MSIIAKTVILLFISNCFMLTAWYFHLKQWDSKPWYVAAFLSWCIAFFEYSVHIPANRIGIEVLTLPQLQVLQVAMSLLVFIPVTIFVMGESIKLDYMWAMICLMGAAYFIFRNTGGALRL